MGPVKILDWLPKSLFSIGFTYQSLLLLDNDTGRQTQSLPQRLVCLSCLALCYACYAHYAADLTAMMTSASAMKVVNSFEQALEEGYTVMVWPNSSDDTYLRTSPPGSARRRCLCIDEIDNINI